MILSILEVPNNKLRQKSKEVKKIDREIKKLAVDLVQTKRANFGVGLAAPQVGKLLRLIIIEAPKEILDKRKWETPEIPQTILINPKISQLSKEKEVFEESCLSLPGLAGEVPRAKEVEVKGLDLKGKKIRINASGLYARVLQHEIDHLDGVLFPDRIEDIKTLKKVPVPYKVVFLGTPEFAAVILEGLIKKTLGISLVITEPDKPVGRRQILTPPPVKKVAQKYNLIIYQPENISNLISVISNLRPDLIILAAYGQIIPKEILKIPKYGALNIHPSLLPKYRGPSPIQAAILNGDKETGVTIIKMDEKIDHGPILAQQELEIRNPKSQLTTKELTQILAKVGADLLIETLPLCLEGKIKPKPQNHKKATYTHLLTKKDGYVEISNLKSQISNLIQEIERKIRAYYPWPKVWTEIDGKRVIIHKAHIEKSKIKNQKSKINLILDIVQPEGKKAMKYEEYLKGNPRIS